MPKNKRTIATDISAKVRKEVKDRDNYCVSCGTSYNLQIAHVYLRRSQGGLGIKENLCVLCYKCHMILDQGKVEQSNQIRAIVHDYMKRHYGEVDLDKIKYNLF